MVKEVAGLIGMAVAGTVGVVITATIAKKTADKIIADREAKGLEKRKSEQGEMVRKLMRKKADKLAQEKNRRYACFSLENFLNFLV